MTVLLNNIDGADVEGLQFELKGQSVLLVVRGDDFDGGSVEIQIASKEDPDVRFLPLPDGTFAAGTTKKIDYLANGSIIRAALVGSGGSAVNIFVGILT